LNEEEEVEKGSWLIFYLGRLFSVFPTNRKWQ
jgi:hypothetical protein